ncbi:hypothetical protein YB2330_003264 [Saitoella coloradoensis]
MEGLAIPPYTPTHPDTHQPLIRRILIANRSEIAVRIIRACQRLGITSIAVYTDADGGAPHVKLADEAIFIGRIEGSKVHPHQDIKLLVSMAKKAKADAIHPGYGYLSENAAFAQAVQDAGLIFIGPSPSSISLLGDKKSAKEYLMTHAKHVPLIPGYSDEEQVPSHLAAKAREIGFPVLIKAASGGGGKGMRIIRSEQGDLEGVIKAAQQEAGRHFGGDERVLVEKYVDGGKHVEVQIFGDNAKTPGGKVWVLGERECSVQRRHQKVVEESPSPLLSSETRAAMFRAAQEIGELLKYEGAGTVEFILDPPTQKFFFLEVNTRIQVEHTITEQVTGLDLVTHQIFVAGGGKLADCPQLANLQIKGHAIEARLCAENPAMDFAPCTGTIRLFVTPGEGRGNPTLGLRVDTGVETGSQITSHFDSMIAKIIVYAPTREQAIEKLALVLRKTACLGVITNLEFISAIIQHAEFRRGRYTTKFIEENIDELLASSRVKGEIAQREYLSAIPSLLVQNLHRRQLSKKDSGFRAVKLGFRNQFKGRSTTTIEHVKLETDDGNSQEALVEFLIDRSAAIGGLGKVRVWQPNAASVSESQEKAFLNKIGGQLVTAYYASLESASTAATFTAKVVQVKDLNHEGEWKALVVRVLIDGVQREFFLATDGPEQPSTGRARTFWLHSLEHGVTFKFVLKDLLTWAGKLDERQGGHSLGGHGEHSYTTSMPCKIVQVMKKDGEIVKAGEPILVMESMKTEIRLNAKEDGVLKLFVKEGDVKAEGAVLCEVLEIVKEVVQQDTKPEATAAGKQSRLSISHGPKEPPLTKVPVGTFFRQQAQKYPDALALISRWQGVRWTYKQMDDLSDKLALGLIALGVKRHDRVGILLGSAVEYSLAQIALAKFGAILVTINPAYTVTELIGALKSVGCTTLITCPGMQGRSYIDLLTEIAPIISSSSPDNLTSGSVPTLKRVIMVDNKSNHLQGSLPGALRYWEDVVALGEKQDKQMLEDIEGQLDYRDVMNLQFTSGTTGNPKAACLTHLGLLNNGVFIGDKMKLTPQDKLCVPPPLFHCFGLVIGNLAAFTHGSAVIYASETFDAASVLKTVSEEKCTALHGVPTMFVAEMEHPDFKKYDMSSLRTGVAAGSLVPSQLMERIHRHLNLTELTICYGMTETSPVSTMTSGEDTMFRRTSTVGRAMPHTSLKVVDPEGNIVPTGTFGELWTAGYCLQTDYWRNPEKTAEVMTTDENGLLWMHTGDEAVMDDDGYIKITGRIKDLIIRGGENIQPSEIEDRLLAHPSISLSSVVGVPSEKYGEEVAAFIVRAPNQPRISDAEVREWVGKTLARYKMPKYVFWCGETTGCPPDFPKTASGKIRKVDLRVIGAELAKKGLGL